MTKDACEHVVGHGFLRHNNYEVHGSFGDITANDLMNKRSQVVIIADWYELCPRCKANIDVAKSKMLYTLSE